MSIDVALQELFPSEPEAVPALARLKVHTPEDLLRVDDRRLSAATKGVLSVQSIAAARSLASLLEVKGMTLARARMLAAAGVESAQALGEQTFDKALAAIGGTETDASLVASWLRDAAVLSHTGALNGTVLDTRGHPIGGARVRGAYSDVQSDDRGRFRLLRLPLWYPLGVLIEKSGFRSTRVRVNGLAPPHIIKGHRFVLKAQARPPQTRELSELTGDVLPRLDGAPLHIRTEKVEQIPRRELVCLVEVTKSDEARLVSCFRRYRDGEFHGVVYGLDRSALPPNAAPGEYFRSDGRGLQRIRISARALSLIKASRRLAREDRAGNTTGRSLSENVRLLRRRLAALRRLGLLERTGTR